MARSETELDRKAEARADVLERVESMIDMAWSDLVRVFDPGTAAVVANSILVQAMQQTLVLWDTKFDGPPN